MGFRTHVCLNVWPKLHVAEFKTRSLEYFLLGVYLGLKGPIVHSGAFYMVFSGRLWWNCLHQPKICAYRPEICVYGSGALACAYGENSADDPQTPIPPPKKKKKMFLVYLIMWYSGYSQQLVWCWNLHYTEEGTQFVLPPYVSNKLFSLKGKHINFWEFTLKLMKTSLDWKYSNFPS